MGIPEHVSKMHALPREKRAEILDSCFKLVELKKEALRLQQEMLWALIQEWNRMDEVKIDRDDFFELLALYYRTVEKGQSQFTWQGKEFVTNYAKYLLQYLETHLWLDDSDKMKIRRMRAQHLTRLPVEEEHPHAKD